MAGFDWNEFYTVFSTKMKKHIQNVQSVVMSRRKNHSFLSGAYLAPGYRCKGGAVAGNVG